MDRVALLSQGTAIVLLFALNTPPSLIYRKICDCIFRLRSSYNEMRAESNNERQANSGGDGAMLGIPFVLVS